MLQGLASLVHLDQEHDYYIGRGSLLGNPYEIGIDGTRVEVIARYKKWFQHLLRSDVFKREILKLRGKRLGCFCHPKRCHGDIIVGFLNILPDKAVLTRDDWQAAIKQYF